MIRLFLLGTHTHTHTRKKLQENTQNLGKGLTNIFSKENEGHFVENTCQNRISAESLKQQYVLYVS